MRGRHDVLCLSSEGLRTWGAFAADVARFRSRIGEATHVCNLFGNRYDFMVGLAAALLNGQMTLLPAAAAAGAAAATQGDADRLLVLGELPPGAEADWHIERVERSDGSDEPSALTRALEASTGEVHVFTSGSTGRPVRHVKDWVSLAGGAALTAAILRELGCEPGSCAILGTTPHQHMYGLEASVFAGLAFGHCLYGGTVFFPADLERAVLEVRDAGFERAVLVSSPAHLKFLQATLLATPAVCGIVSATAPLSLAQAHGLEARGDLPVMEIYGSTETGSLASRRTVGSDEWQALEGFVLEAQAEGVIATAPHLRSAVPLADAVELRPGQRFRLLGRLGDMVSVAGKRTTLAALSAILLETPGILDGVVLQRRSEAGDALAVAAVLDRGAGVTEAEAKAAIRHAFRQQVDPVFLSKRIRFLERLPRLASGKIPAEELDRLKESIGL
ncbi:MAG: hypothetical protein WD100_04505 [Tistlia sp.]